MDNILNWLTDIVSPKEAEAKIVGDPQSMQLIRDRYNASQQLPQQNDYLSSMYNDIIKAADKRPESVSVNQAPELNGVYGSVGDYSNRKISYDPAYSKEDSYSTIAHELLHFLNNATGSNLSTSQQHELIKVLLGSDVYKPVNELKEYQKPQLSKEQTLILKKWLGE